MIALSFEAMTSWKNTDAAMSKAFVLELVIPSTFLFLLDKVFYASKTTNKVLLSEFKERRSHGELHTKFCALYMAFSHSHEILTCRRARFVQSWLMHFQKEG